MILVDANLLLYAYNADAPEHDRAKAWLNSLLAGHEWIGFPWITLWAFLRISTNPRFYRNPLPVDEVFAVVKDMLAQPRVTVLEPGFRHAEILHRLVADYKAAGKMLTDAALAALAIEHGASLASADQDFRRFPKMKWFNPLESNNHLQ